MSEWPKRVTAYVHGSKESMRRLGEEAGLSEAALCRFRYALYELRVELEVQENGDSIVIAIDGAPHVT